MTLLEDQIRTPASTAMPEATRHKGYATPPREVYGPLRSYSTSRDQVLYLGKEPAREDMRRNAGGHYWCNRGKGHAGRHARVRYDLRGRVRAVWGVRAAAEKTS